ncbi:acetate/propionate family kinase [Tabrizicola sp.]|uniref:acetate/propionate family kinase n=1 Tax=Tabrizicola sp. TaxID=2005166 RepID=UPI0027346D81|nr:acetate kinase [Tabrizicola sp.]MDP3194578.1 acetate kinase [Tabrizicola sp.]
MWLIVNAGSSSLKLKLFDAGREVAKAFVGEIGPDGHASAMAEGLAQAGVSVSRLTAAAHRVVHGGAGLTATCRVTPPVLRQIEDCVPLAPLHNPANLVGIQAVAKLAPGLPQYAAFDTAFHATNPEVAVAYALPQLERDRGLRRYGFHGISYAALVRMLGARGPLPERLLACHLGNGCSLAAIVNGRSVATTMGYSPLDGLTMGTRTGEIDGNAVLRLAEVHGIERASRILNRESGLLGLGGASDLRALHSATSDAARFALRHFAYWAVRHAGSMVAAMGGLDAVVFTGGIGENDAWMRKEILSGLSFLGVSPDHSANARNETVLHDTTSRVVILVVPADEERQIALEAQAVMSGEAQAGMAGEGA